MSETLSLESSKRLHELGVKVEVSKYYREMYYKEGNQWELDDNSGYSDEVTIPAPTFEELWAVMPESIVYEQTHFLIMRKADGITVMGYYDMDRDGNWAHWVASTPIEAAGEIAIWLAENGHMEVNDEG